VIRGCPHPRFPNQISNRLPKWPSLLRRFARIPAPEFRTESSLDSRIGRFPKSGPPTVEIPGFRTFATPHLRRTKFPELSIPANSKLRRSQSSCIREFPAPEKHTLRIPLDFDVSRVMYFPEFPNTSPSGKRVDSDDPIPRTFRKFSKKRHPRNVGGDTRHPGSKWRLNRGTLRETAPPWPYK
jgi:hypothetical protein